MTLMILGIWILVIVATAQFVWYAIVAPSLRLRLRYRLFEQRDRLRALRIIRGAELAEPVFVMLEEGINCGIFLLSEFEFSLITAMQINLGRNAELQKKVMRRRELLDGCQVKEVQAIRKAVARTMRDALLVNSAGWVIWLLPMIVGIAFGKALRQSISNLLSLRQPEVERMGIVPTAFA